MDAPEEEKLSQDRWYWGWYGIFLTLLATSPFIPASLGIPCSVIGLGGLLIQMREGFKARISRIRLSRAQLLVFTRVAAVVMLTVLGIKTISLVFEIKGAFDTYVVPRGVTEKQANALRDYLSKHEPSAVSVRVNSFNDQEAMEYASELFNALRHTTWDINPPTHSGPEFIRRPAAKPKANDVDAKGRPLYKSYNDYLDASDAWLEGEIDRKIADQTYGGNPGLCLEVEDAGQPTNPDPKHPAPDVILRDALRYAGIEASCGRESADTGKYTVSLFVGHRPISIGQNLTWRSRLVRWLSERSQ
ncbi:MAG TPA: hypothetical protein VN948_05890 [Terriglobales bacterium]|nr:hypothetical protein [Terriglobales bacterium]